MLQGNSWRDFDMIHGLHSNSHTHLLGKATGSSALQKSTSCVLDDPGSPLDSSRGPEVTAGITTGREEPDILSGSNHCPFHTLPKWAGAGLSFLAVLRRSGYWKAADIQTRKSAVVRHNKELPCQRDNKAIPKNGRDTSLFHFVSYKKRWWTSIVYMYIGNALIARARVASNQRIIPCERQNLFFSSSQTD